MLTTRKKPLPILLFSPCGNVAGGRTKIRSFRPQNFRLLLAQAKTQDDRDIVQAFVQIFHENVKQQLRELLLSLGVDPSSPRAFERGFLKLGVEHYGVGQLAWHPARSSRNSATWTRKQDRDLLELVIRLTARGLSERAAIETLAKDQKMLKRFPYREKTHASDRAATKKRCDALRARLQLLKRLSTNESLLRQLLGPDLSGSLEFALFQFDTKHLPKPTLAKNETVQKSRVCN